MVAWVILLGPHAVLPPVLNWAGPHAMALVGYLGLVALALLAQCLKVPERISGSIVVGWYFAMIVFNFMGYIDGGEFWTAGLRW